MPPAAADTLLLNVQGIAVTDSMAVVLDYAEKAVMAFAPSGRLLWRYARTGRGPGGLEWPAAISIAADGGIWLAERATARAYRFSSDGRLAETVSLPFVPERVVGADSARLAVMPGLLAGPQYVSRSGGERSPQVAPQDALVAVAEPQARVNTYLTGLSDGRIAVTYAQASLTLLHDGRSPPVRLLGPGGQGFPVVKRVPLGNGRFTHRFEGVHVTQAFELFAIGDTLFVGSSLEAEERSESERVAVLDAYSLSARKYIGSLRLPRVNGESLACSARVCAMLVLEPEPSVSFWRLRLGLQR